MIGFIWVVGVVDGGNVMDEMMKIASAIRIVIVQEILLCFSNQANIYWFCGLGI